MKNTESAAAKKEEEAKALRAKLQLLQDNEKLREVQHSKEIAVLNHNLEQEKEAAKKGLLELAEMSKRQEMMFSSSMYEIEGFMNQLISEKKGKSSTNVTKLMLSKLAEEQTSSPQKSDDLAMENQMSSSPQEKKPRAREI